MKKITTILIYLTFFFFLSCENSSTDAYQISNIVPNKISSILKIESYLVYKDSEKVKIEIQSSDTSVDQKRFEIQSSTKQVSIYSFNDSKSIIVNLDLQLVSLLENGKYSLNTSDYVLLLSILYDFKPNLLSAEFTLANGDSNARTNT